MKTPLVLSAALLACAAGCGEKKSSPPAPTAGAAVPGAAPSIRASCNNIQVLSTCTGYDAQALALGEAFIKGACEAQKGSYGTRPCPEEKSLGTCVLEGGQWKKYYAQGTLAYDLEDAAKDCRDVSKGRWTAAATPARR
jgi:hypothetical protein